MERVGVSLKDNSYDIFIGRGVINRIDVSADKVLAIVDENVYGKCFHIISKLVKDMDVYVVRSGERSKSFEVLEDILKFMLNKGYTRKSKILAVGGGVVGDLSGVAASLYMRGIEYYQIPTTLLSAVDSSVGGKTAINFCGIKNVIGSFYQPKGVYIDVDFFKTLGENEWLCGFGEIVKSSLLSRHIYDFIAENRCDFSMGIDNSLIEIIRRCVEFKAGIVSRDEKESGERKLLNLGHTVAHAFEGLADLGSEMRHGEFVLIGLYYELKMASRLGMLAEDISGLYLSYLEKYLRVILKIEDMDAFIEKMRHDKKNESDRISFVLMNGEFSAEEVLLTENSVRAILEAI